MNRLIVFALIIIVGLISCGKEQTGPDETSNSLFTRTAIPVFESPLDLAADPSVLRSGDTLFIYYTAENGIAVALSTDDGNTWNIPDGNGQEDFIALAKQPNDWDQTLETADVVKVERGYKMYYTGYRENESDNAHLANYEIGLATSNDGINFLRHPLSQNQALISRDTTNENTYDRHAMTSPGVVYYNDAYFMIYAGWNVTDDWTGENAGIRILGATSSDGVNWDKLSAPIIQASDIAFSPDVNEASLIRSEDGFWYIPFSTDVSIGIARSTTFSEGYDIYPAAIVSPDYDWDSEVTAPDGLIEDGKMKLWYHGVKAPAYWPWVIGYSEAVYPLQWD